MDDKRLVIIYWIFFTNSRCYLNEQNMLQRREIRDGETDDVEMKWTPKSE